MRFSAILVAAGAGLRAGGDTPKQWRTLAGRPVARWALEGLLAAGCAEVVVVISPAHRAEAEHAFAGLSGWHLVDGGTERTHSVTRGLAALSDSVEAILIHDAARPFVTRSCVAALVAALENADGAVPALPVSDTLKRGAEDRIVETVRRDNLYRAQTPQAFRLDVLRRAYASATDTATDDAALVEAVGGRVKLVPGDPMLFKLTYPEDFPMAEHLAGTRRQTRTGLGFDAHRWGAGDAVWLCGVRIDHGQTLVGHSDADAGLHALTDAILGALALGDIGDHFPPTDLQWKGASSDRFLIHARDLAISRGARINHVDVTLVCEQPRIKPHREAMRQRVATLLDLALDQVSIKATTTEGMGFTGRGEGLAAQAIATLDCPV
jgi:2-C-methyl-D-erythritol 4-phosphate cytidylyltransferase/2-C-methyl-D-erythritol 2,4-cyclodiphosphate synthase